MHRSCFSCFRVLHLPSYHNSNAFETACTEARRLHPEFNRFCSALGCKDAWSEPKEPIGRRRPSATNVIMIRGRMPNNNDCPHLQAPLSSKQASIPTKKGKKRNEQEKGFREHKTKPKQLKWLQLDLHGDQLHMVVALEYFTQCSIIHIQDGLRSRRLRH